MAADCCTMKFAFLALRNSLVDWPAVMPVTLTDYASVPSAVSPLWVFEWMPWIRHSDEKV